MLRNENLYIIHMEQQRLSVATYGGEGILVRMLRLIVLIDSFEYRI